jgi:AraC-like DNA-binding protein
LKKIIPAFDFTKQLNNHLGFSFTKLEESYTGYNAVQPHRHKYYEVIYFSETGGVHEVDFNVFNIHAHSIHFVSPEQVHLLRREKHVLGYVLSFSDEFFLESEASNIFTSTLPYFNNPYANPLLQLKTTEQNNECVSFLLKIKDEFYSENPDKRLAIQSWMKLLLITCKRFYTSENFENTQPYILSDITLKFKKLLEVEFRNIKSVSDYAQLLNLSPGYLSETIQKDTGKTAGEFIHDRLVLETKRLLFHSQKSIKEIAAELKYDDPSYFSKFFKTHTGTTPELFRQAIREKYQ